MRWKEKWLNWRKKMGEVNDTVKGSGLKSKPTKDSDKNLVSAVQSLRDEVSHLISIKDEDTLKEGKDKVAENTRKAGTLRAVHSLLVASQSLLEDY
jgi:hypothetical protein